MNILTLITISYCNLLIVNAEEIKISKEKILSFNLDPADMKKLSDTFLNDDITIFKIPDNNLVVPLLGPATHENPVPVIHIRDYKCPLRKCRESRAKVHTLLKKEGPLCLHNLLAWCTAGNESNEQPMSEGKSSRHHLDRDLTVEYMTAKIIDSFPSMSSDNSEFLGY